MIRFLSPSKPQLRLDAVPAVFRDGVCDIDEADVMRLSRMRYLGVPHGVVEIGTRTTISEFESFIDRTGATTGQMVVLAPDGRLTFADVPGS